MPDSCALYASTDQFADDLERFRVLQSFCGHDLRLQLGAAAGLLQLLTEDTNLPEPLRNHPHLLAAASSTSQALNNLDRVLSQINLSFRTVWVATDWKAPSEAQVNILRALEVPCLFIRMQNGDEILKRMADYRPSFAVIEKSRIGADFDGFIQRLGPHFVKIFVICHASEQSVSPAQGLIRYLPPDATWSNLAIEIERVLAINKSQNATD
jgi:hypothetical protein